MPRYRINEAHFLDNKYYEAGAIVDWDGAPSKHMTPVEQVAEERKAKYDEGRPHRGVSRDLPPRASAVHDPLARQPGMPRVAGPPGQVHAASADPANPVRTAEIVEARREIEDKASETFEQALQPEPPKPAPAARNRAADDGDAKPASKK